MAAMHSLRLPQAGRTQTAVVAAETAAATTGDRVLWLQVGIASALGATAGLLATWAIVATQTLQMHF